MTVEGYRVQSMAAVLLPHQNDLRATLAGLTANTPIDLEACPFSLGPPVLPDTPVAANAAALDLENLLATDQLLVADCLHRVRLYKFGCRHIDASAMVANGDASSARQHLMPQELDPLNLQQERHRTHLGSRMMQTVLSAPGAPPIGSSLLSTSLPIRQTTSDSTIAGGSGSSGARNVQLFSALASAIRNSFAIVVHFLAVESFLPLYGQA